MQKQLCLVISKTAKHNNISCIVGYVVGYIVGCIVGYILERLRKQLVVFGRISKTAKAVVFGDKQNCKSSCVW